VKLERAQKLVAGLSDEQQRWGQEIKIMEKNGENTVANCIIAAGMISYAGPFTSIYRQQLEASWNASLVELGLKHTKDVSMRDFMGVPVTIQGWNLCGLPKDDTSTENGIIIEKSRRFSLMIDP
jgi:dynein heavy chain